jgi:hypothetical protein
MVGCAVESFPAPADGDHVIASALERRAEFVGGRQKTWLTVRNRALHLPLWLLHIYITACLVTVRNYSLGLSVSLRVYAAAFSGRPDMIETDMARLHCTWVSAYP